MQTDREKTIEALWQNSGHGTRWADVAAAYDAGVAAERERCAQVCEALTRPASGALVTTDEADAYQKCADEIRRA